MGFIIRIDNFKKKSLCELKLKTEKFENIHKKKKEKIRKKRKEKEKQIHVGAKEQKRRRKKDFEACDIEVNHR